MPGTFVAAPRSVVGQAVSDMVGWRLLGERMVIRAKELCPVGKDAAGEAHTGAHLRDTLAASFITGADPRILIGSRSQGQKLEWVTKGTPPHPIDPVNASVLRFTVPGGQVVFARHVEHPGTKPNRFLLDAIMSIAQGTAAVA